MLPSGLLCGARPVADPIAYRRAGRCLAVGKGWATALLCVLLAGCASEGSKKDVVEFGDGSRVELEGDDPSAGKGSILGVVVDETIRPIVGAHVSVTGSDATAVTDSSGVFHVADLEPGTYFFRVNATGFLPTQASADVIAGEVQRMRIQLQVDTTPQPFHQTLAFEGFIQAWLGIGQFYATGDNNDTACACTFRFTPAANVSTFVYEAVWEAVAPDPAGLGEYYPELYQADGGGLDFNGYCFSPCHFHINANGYVQGSEVIARFTGPDLWVSVQQDFTVFITLWHNGAAPEEWSFVAGDP
jgi:hypothetical protein